MILINNEEITSLYSLIPGDVIYSTVLEQSYIVERGFNNSCFGCCFNVKGDCKHIYLSRFELGLIKISCGNCIYKLYKNSTKIDKKIKKMVSFIINLIQKRNKNDKK